MIKTYFHALHAAEAVKRRIKALGRDESGATMLEYTLLAGLISVVAIGTITLVGGQVQTIWTNINAAMTPPAA